MSLQRTLTDVVEDGGVGALSRHVGRHAVVLALIRARHVPNNEQAAVVIRYPVCKSDVHALDIKIFSIITNANCDPRRRAKPPSLEKQEAVLKATAVRSSLWHR